jgi:hypothetical protein
MVVLTEMVVVAKGVYVWYVSACRFMIVICMYCLYAPICKFKPPCPHHPCLQAASELSTSITVMHTYCEEFANSDYFTLENSSPRINSFV